MENMNNERASIVYHRCFNSIPDYDWSGCAGMERASIVNRTGKPLDERFLAFIIAAFIIAAILAVVNEAFGKRNAYILTFTIFMSILLTQPFILGRLAGLIDFIREQAGL